MVETVFASKKKKRKKSFSCRHFVSLFESELGRGPFFFGVQSPQDGFKLSEGTSLDS